MAEEAAETDREAALAKLEDQQQAQRQRVVEASELGASALFARDVAAAAVQEHDGRVGVAVRAMTAEGLSPAEIIAELGFKITEEEVRRHLAVDAVSRQQAIEADRVPYGERPASEDDDAELAWDQQG